MGFRNAWLPYPLTPSITAGPLSPMGSRRTKTTTPAYTVHQEPKTLRVPTRHPHHKPQPRLLPGTGNDRHAHNDVDPLNLLTTL
jgi:hypothetical protein